jgi:hypothetical protein
MGEEGDGSEVSLVCGEDLYRLWREGACFRDLGEGEWVECCCDRYAYSYLEVIRVGQGAMVRMGCEGLANIFEEHGANR